MTVVELRADDPTRRLTVAVACPCGKHATGFEATVIRCVGCGALYVVSAISLQGLPVSPTTGAMCAP